MRLRSSVQMTFGRLEATSTWLKCFNNKTTRPSPGPSIVRSDLSVSRHVSMTSRLVHSFRPTVRITSVVSACWLRYLSRSFSLQWSVMFNCVFHCYVVSILSSLSFNRRFKRLTSITCAVSVSTSRCLCMVGAPWRDLFSDGKA